MDGKHVVFGKLVEGLEILKALEKVGEKNEKPKKPIKSETKANYKIISFTTHT